RVQPRPRHPARDAGRQREGRGGARAREDRGGVTAVLLLAHGTPESLDEMPAYLARVRGGRPPSPELVAEMRHNYAAIGGRSPLTDITRAQAAALSRALGGTPVYVGMRNWRPLIADTLAEAAAAGVRAGVAVALAAAADEGARRVLVVPIGFVCDHTEILFDIDVQAAAAARRRGLTLGRTASLNTSATFIRALADLVHAAS